MPDTMRELLQMMRNHPMRKSSQHSTPKGKTRKPESPVHAVSPLGKSFMQVLSVMSKCFKGGYTTGQDSQADVPGLTYFKAEKQGSKPAALLAIQDGKANDTRGDSTELEGEDGEEPKLNDCVPGPAEALAHLKKSLAVSKTAKTACAQTPMKAFKRPAGAAGAGQKPAGTPLKRPAAATPSSTPRPKRCKWSKLPPLALREAYAAGCPKCRWTSSCTPSCWRLRGY